MSSKKRKQARDKLTPSAGAERPESARSPASAPGAPPPPAWRRRASLAAMTTAIVLFAFTIAILYVAPATAESLGHGSLQSLRVVALILLLAGMRLGRAPAVRSR
jgi:hypothetical protein